MIIRVFAGALILIGAAGFFMPFLIGTVIADTPSLELPLSDISDVALSSDGDLYFALKFAGRMQQYSRESKFVRAFAVNAAGGMFCAETRGEKLFVYARRRNVSDEFDLSGRLTRLDIPETAATSAGRCQLDS